MYVYMMITPIEKIIIKRKAVRRFPVKLTFVRCISKFRDARIHIKGLFWQINAPLLGYIIRGGGGGRGF